MPEPLFTYDYHEQFLDSVSKYSMLLNLFKIMLTFLWFLSIFSLNFQLKSILKYFSWNVRPVAWSYFQVSLPCVEGKLQLVCLNTFAVVDLGEGRGPPLFWVKKIITKGRQAWWVSKNCRHPSDQKFFGDLDKVKIK